jgi:hypothetical protein
MAVEPSAEDAALARLELERIARGALGLGLIAAALVLTPRVGAAALLLAHVGLVALRGCPTCWTVGLIQTISAGRLRRTCVDGAEDGAGCTLRRSQSPPPML